MEVRSACLYQTQVPRQPAGATDGLGACLYGSIKQLITLPTLPSSGLQYSEGLEPLHLTATVVGATFKYKHHQFGAVPISRYRPLDALIAPEF